MVTDLEKCCMAA